MYTYSIFSVNPKIAIHYFYKTGILFRFLQEVQEHPKDKLLQMQYKYVIKPLSYSDIITLVQKWEPSVEIEKRDQYIKLHWRGKQMTIYEDCNHLKVACGSLGDMEEFLFPALRNSSNHYFAISNRMDDYGWLAVKNNRMVDNQILYSYR